MGSSITWLDFSEHERRKALDIIDTFREREARDELGIGTVRDALSDVLFPGVSTIQTRARYFLFIPWIYLSLERKRSTASGDTERLARREEVRLIDALADAGETEGVIGIEARKTLKRLPSHVYWQGLEAWGLRRLSISQSDYHRFFTRFATHVAHTHDAVEEEGERDASLRKVWHEEIPPPPEDFPATANFKLRKVESEYLRERLLARQPGKLITYLVDRTIVPSESAFPWEHPGRAEFPELNLVQLGHARCFSLVMHGAALLYNLMLSELQQSEEGAERFTQDVSAWVTSIESEKDELHSWDRKAFWQLVRAQNPRISPLAREFIDRWMDLAIFDPSTARLRDNVEARTLIANRERRLKGMQSRFANERALELWGGASGAYQLSYRWFQAQRIVNDIVDGFGYA